MAKKRIDPVDLPLKRKLTIKSSRIKSAPKSTRSKKKLKGSGKFIAYAESIYRKKGGKLPPSSRRAKHTDKVKANAKAAKQAKARAARVAKIKKRGPIKQPKTRNPRKKGS